MLSQLAKQIFDEVIAWWKKVWFEARLKARLDMIEFENRIEAELERERQAKPIYIEHPIDPVVQTGESKLLGGAMELKAPWYDNGLEPGRPSGEAEASDMDDRP